MAPPRAAAIVNGITISRLVVVAAAYVVLLETSATWTPWAVVVLTLLAVGTDILDGVLARRWGTTSPLGANLDSAVDFVFYASLVAWAWIWRPSLFALTAPYVAFFVVLYILSMVLAKSRRGEMGFHNFWTRLAGTVGIVTCLWSITFGFQIALGVVLVGALGADLAQRIARTLKTPLARAPSAPEIRR